MRKVKPIVYSISFISLIAGILLLSLNVFGLFKSLRNPDIYNEQDISRQQGITLKLEETMKEIKQKPDESDKDFVIRANNVVTNSMIHYWKKEGLKKYNLEIPAWENYIIWLSSRFKDDKRYEFVHYYKKNLERGVGLCSTHSIALSGVLKDNGIESEFWDITRHVILRAKVGEDEWYVMDPDYGLYVPHDREDILQNTELVRPTYANMADLYKPDYETEYNTDFLVKAYGSEGNKIYEYNKNFEIWAYRLKWVIPFLLLLPYLVIAFTRKPV